MTECPCDGVGTRFDEAYAAEKLARYRSAGPDPSTQMLIDLVAEEDIQGLTLLDIGGGVGAVQHGLIERGVARVLEVEASPSSAAACAAEAERQGHGERVTHLSGDFASVSRQVEPADIVTLDRSVCCWHDPLGLIDQSAAKARWLYAVVYPRDAWWVRHVWRHFGNFKQILKRNSLRLSTPRSKDVEATVAEHGLSLAHHREMGVWQVALFAKDVH